MGFNRYLNIWLGIMLSLLTSCGPGSETITHKPLSLSATPMPVVPSNTTEFDPAISSPTTEATLMPHPRPATTGAPSAKATPMIEPAPVTQLAQQATDGAAHPYLLFTQQDVAQFRVEIDQLGNFRRELFTALSGYLRQDESSSMLASAFFYLLTGDSTQLTRARNMLMQEVAQDCWDADGEYCRRDRIAANTLGQVSLAYDWLYLQLSPVDRDQVKARIATEVCHLYEAFTYGKNNEAEGWNNWWMTDYTQNHFHSVTGGMVLGALAIRNDNSPTCTATSKDGHQTVVTDQQILDLGLQKMERNYLIFNQIADGSYPEGDSYVTAYGETYLNALWATHRLLSLDFVKEKRLGMFPLFYLFNAPPGQLWNQFTNHGDSYTSSRENYWFPKDLHLTATVHQSRLATWLAEQYYYDKRGRVEIDSKNYDSASNLVLDFVFLDPTLAPQSPAEANLDLSYHATDWEGVFMRSDWTETAVAAAIKTGPPGGHTAYNIARSNYQFDQWVGGGQEPTEFDLNVSHVHADANGIYLYANNTFLLPEMPGYRGGKTPWGPYTSSHNTIMVSDSQDRIRGQIQGDTIGGVGLGYRKWDEGSEYFWDIETPESKVGIIEHAATQGYDYSLGQATSAYWPELGLKRFHRHVLFVRDPGYLLVVDDLDADSAKTYDWMGHSTGTVTQEEHWLKVHADNDQRLGLAVLSPSAFAFIEPSNNWEGIKLDDIYGFRYVSENRTMYEWKIRQNCQTCRFITLLFPTDESHWAQKPTVDKLADTGQLAAIQVHFENNDRVDTLAISLAPDQTTAIGNLSFDGRAAALEKVGSTIHRALLIHGTILREGNTSLIQDLPLQSFLEVQYQGANLILRSPDPTGATLFAPGVTTVFLQCVDENNVVITNSIPFSRNGDYITLDILSG